MNFKFFSICCVLASFGSLSSNAQEQKKFNYNLYGFVRAETFVDTYKGVDAGYELFYIAPLYVGKDANGKDINKQTSANLQALASRVGVNINGPDVFGAKTSATIEVDFGGIVKTEPTLLRIRQAFVSFKWENSSLLAGQTWHPFWGAGTAQVSGLNTGAPFQAFNRSPQLRYNHNVGDLTFSLSGVYESQYTSKTFESSVYTSANQAQRNGVMPELVLSAAYNMEKLQVGIGGQVKRLKPRMTTKVNDNVYVSGEFITTYGAMAYLYYKGPKLTIVAKDYYGQNLSHLTLIGGYGVASRDDLTGAETYTPYVSNSCFLNAVYGTKWQGGLTLGYSRNFGTKDALYNGNFKDITGGLLPDVKDLCRLAPHLSLNISNLKFIFEYEVTSAKYGVGELDYSDGLFLDSHRATNNRLGLTMIYMFN